MDPQHEDKRLTPEQLESLLKEASSIIQKPSELCSEDELDVLMSLINHTQFFQKNLDSRVRLEDFLQRIKRFLTFEMHPRGTVLLQDGQHAEKLSVIIQGTAVRFREKPLAEIEFEAGERTVSFATLKPDEENGTGSARRQSPENPTPRLKYRASTFASRKKNAGRSKKLAESKTVMNIHHQGSLHMDTDHDEKDKIYSSFHDSIGEVDEEDNQESERKYRSMKSVNLLSIKERKKTQMHRKGDNKKIAKTRVIQEPLMMELMGAIEIDEEANAAMKEHDIALFKMMTEQTPQLITKYFVGDIFRLKRVRELKPGNQFGEAFLKINKQKESLLVATQDISLLSIKKDDYIKVMTELFEEVQEKVKFFSSVLPSFTEVTVTLFAYYFKEVLIKKGEKIYSEDEPTDGIYLLRTGDVRLFKNIEVIGKDKGSYADSLLIGTFKSAKPAFPVASVVEGQFFGEEPLLKEVKRSYTAIAKTNTKVYFLAGWLYQKIKGTFVDVKNILKGQAHEKLNWRQMRVEEMMANVGSLDNVTAPSVKKLDYKDKQGSYKKLKGKGLDHHHHHHLVNNGAEHATLTEPSNPYMQDLQKPRQSISESFEAEYSAMKSLEIYKEKFYRDTYTKNVIANEHFIKKSDHPKPRANITLNGRLLEPLAPVKEERKQLYISVNQTYLPPVSKVSSPMSMLAGHDGSPRHDISLPKIEKAYTPTRPTTKAMKNLRSNVLKFLAPEMNQIGLDDPVKNKDVIKNNDGSITVVTGRSRLRGILKSFEQMPNFYHAFQSPSPRKEEKVYQTSLQTNLKTEGDIKGKPKKKVVNNIHMALREQLNGSPVGKAYKMQPDILNSVISTQKLNLVKHKTG